MEAIVSVEHVSKKFKLYYDRPLTLKERIIRGSKGVYKEFYALTDVSFKVKKGSTVGLIGQNGCGKSTLLKIINRTMFPEEGKVDVKGKVASLIELGAGFHPELSGRENIYTNATVFGITKDEIEKRIPDIIRFSELDHFIDNPIRTYSSGMYARLAFSVAIHVDADILLVDEILGVGDMNFQAKCADKIYEMRKNGTTMILVTHDMGTIDRLCDYAVWLDKGIKLAEGEPENIQTMYMTFMTGQQEERQRAEQAQAARETEEGLTETDRNKEQQEDIGSRKIILEGCRLMNAEGTDQTTFLTGEDLKLGIHYKCTDSMTGTDLCISMEIKDEHGVTVYGTDIKTDMKTDKNITIQNEGLIEVFLQKMHLLAGRFVIGIHIMDKDKQLTYADHPDLAAFQVNSIGKDRGIVRMPFAIYLDGRKITDENQSL